VDGHQVVLRINQAPAVGPYTPHVGGRTTLRLLNRVWTLGYANLTSEVLSFLALHSCSSFLLFILAFHYCVAFCFACLLFSPRSFVAFLSLDFSLDCHFCLSDSFCSLPFGASIALDSLSFP
jgi:hypothetical protein